MFFDGTLHCGAAVSLICLLSRAGVIGLQTALTLLRAGYDVSIVAEWWPGEAVGGYTSDWSVINFTS